MQRLSVLLVMLFTVAFVAACSSSRSTQPLANDLPKNQSGTVLVAGVEDTEALKAQAKEKNLEVTGDAVLQIHGNTDVISELTVAKTDEVAVMFDEAMNIEKFEKLDAPDETVYYLAKKDFNLPEYWKTNPTHDGRGVIVGVLDDGVVTRASGFQKTTEGKRKLLAKGSDTSILDFTLTSTSDRETLSAFAKSTNVDFTTAWQGTLDEATTRHVPDGTYMSGRTFDINLDGKETKIDLAVFEKEGKTTVCVDSSANSTAEAGECFGTFEATGEAGFWDSNKLLSIDAEFDKATGKLVLGSGERGYSHGSGVASVVAGHMIGGKFSGVAPGAQLLDYNLSAPTGNNVAAYYTVGKFVRGLEWLGQKKADIVNISYSFFFHSAKSQEFIKKAFQTMTTKYGYIISFSAGNNGPGLGSMNRRPVYPAEALVNGAYVSRELDEYVHGVTGLPPEGRVIFYSSRGPSSDKGQGVAIISPLASLTHANPEAGYQAFGGTSSASPAAAGLAAVMISAIKEMGWKKDNLAVVNAIRMSGQPLPGIPFVDQGYGLPKIEKALAAYKKIIDGENFAFVSATVTPSTSPDGVSSSGVFLRATQLLDRQEFRANIKGLPGSTVGKDEANELLIPVKITYSHPWMRGASRLWLSVSQSGFSFEVLRPEALANEETGEIRITRGDNDELLHVIPVTLVNDHPLTQPLTHQFVLGAEEGQRFHFSVPNGVKATLVDFDIRDGSHPSTVGFRYYNSSSVWTQSPTTTQYLMETTTPGWNQVAIYRNKGAETPSTVNVKLRPVNARLAQEFLKDQNSTLELDVANTDGRTDLEFQLSEPRKVIATQVFDTAQSKGLASLQFPMQGRGSYRVNLSSLVKNEMVYPSFSCLLAIMTEDRVQYYYSVGSGEDESITDDLKGTMTASCYSFEHVDDSNTYGTNVVLEASFVASPAPAPVATGRVTLKNGRTSVPLTWVKPAGAGSVLKVNVKTITGAGSATVGEVKVY